MINRDDSHIELVSAGTEVSSEQIPANGAEWEITYIEADAPSSSDGWVSIIWDYGGVGEQPLFLTYTSKAKRTGISVVGDGVKKLAIVLHNESASSLFMSGAYEAREL